MTERTSCRSKKYKLIAVITAYLIIGLIITAAFPAPGQCKPVSGGSIAPWDGYFLSAGAPPSCTIFTASFGDTVLFGNNEDWVNPKTYYWTVPPEGKRFGALFFGFDNFFPQGGVNEKGLAFDINALPLAELNEHPEKPRWRKHFYDFLFFCSTVEEVIHQVRIHSWERTFRAQVHVADATGDAVVISAGPDGEIAFTRKAKGAGYLVSTNFNRANPKSGRYPCWRYDIADKALQGIKREEDLTVDLFRSILRDVHQEGISVNTVYSNIIDLKQGMVYLYHWYQFDEVVTLDVAAEITKKTSHTLLGDLFSAETVRKATAAFQAHQDRIAVWRNMARGWYLLAALSVVVLFRRLMRESDTSWWTRFAWTGVTLLFGPLGLIFHGLAARVSPSPEAGKPAARTWVCAFWETLLATSGFTFGIVFAYLSLFYCQAFNESSLWSILWRFYGLPLFVGFFFVHVPVIARIQKISYTQAVRRRLFWAVIAFNFLAIGLVPVSGVAMTLCEMHLGLHQPWDVLFWGSITLGAFAGAATLLPYTAVAARRGYCCAPWPQTAPEGGHEHAVMASPSPGFLWGSLLVSTVLMTGAIFWIFAFLS